MLYSQRPKAVCRLTMEVILFIYLLVSLFVGSEMFVSADIHRWKKAKMIVSTKLKLIRLQYSAHVGQLGNEILRLIFFYF